MWLRQKIADRIRANARGCIASIEERYRVNHRRFDARYGSDSDKILHPAKMMRCADY